MKLCYWTEPNFGDRLNPYMFPRLLPNFFDEDPETLVVGIGSILGGPQSAPHKSTKRIVVFGTGAGYHSVPYHLPNYHFLCVRGPRTARYLGLPREVAVTDGALLVHLLGHRRGPTRYPVSFMPHYDTHFRVPEWKLYCERAGLHYLSPLLPVEQMLDEMASSERIITEAMHGAIVADALRVPWTAVVSDTWINTFKWVDWCESMELTFQPQSLAGVGLVRQWNFRLNENVHIPELLKKVLRRPLVWGHRAHRGMALDERAQRSLEKSLLAPTQLSQDSVHQRRTEQLQEKLEELRHLA